MFKILIVDDEIFTREGIIEQIPWDKLGINEVQQAFDGVNALEIAASYKPDILLTDVRMPRMDGIQLSFRLREIYPSCEIIFMSGYSDKEYLKSAIKLKAVSYVEKPIDLEELQTAIESAVISKSKEIKLNETIKLNIAAELLNRNINVDKLKQFLGKEPFTLANTSDFITLIISFNSSLEVNKQSMLSIIEDQVAKAGLSSFFYIKSNDEIILHLYARDNSGIVKKECIDKLCFDISLHLSQLAKLFICAGTFVKGICNVFLSYEAALEVMNKTFFFDYGSVLYKDSDKHKAYKFNENVIAHFVKFLSLEDKHQSILLIKRLTCEIKACTATSSNCIKDFYYRLLLQLIKFAAERNIQLNENFSGSESMFESFTSLSTIYELEEFITMKIEELFKHLEDKNANVDPITNIMRFIHDNYRDPGLSLPMISKNTFLSPTYICKIFKDQTGTTINKYIGEYRLNKAKDFLKDKEATINDIAAKVGYGDGNYFTKIFKKETGLTPSDYRKKYLS